MGEVEWFQEYEELSLDCNDKEHQNDFYLTENKLGILFGVSHAVGDYIIIEMDK
ncbi:hypothetical protein AALA79_21940 [Lachnospiraceae bacterium 64-25]